MKLTDKALERIDRNLTDKKKARPLNGSVIGIGVNLKDSIGGATVFKDNWGICEVEDLSRMIEELTMLRDAITEETGIIL